MPEQEELLTHSFVECARCFSDEKAGYVVRSDLMYVRASEACAEAARKLGL